MDGGLDLDLAVAGANGTQRLAALEGWLTGHVPAGHNSAETSRASAAAVEAPAVRAALAGAQAALVEQLLRLAVLAQGQVAATYSPAAQAFLGQNCPPDVQSLAGDPTALAGLAAALGELYRSLEVERRGELHRELAEVLGRAVDAGECDEWEGRQALWQECQSSGDRAAQHAESCRLAIHACQRGDLEGQRVWEARAAEAWPAPGTAADMPSPLFNRVQVLRLLETGAPQEAMALCDATLAQLAALDTDHALQGSLHGDIAGLHFDRGELLKARAEYDRALSLLRRAGANRQYGMMLSNVGLVCYRQGLFAEARSLFEEAFAIASRCNNLRGKAGTLTYLAALHLDMGNVELARSCYEQALDLARQRQDVATEAAILGNLGNVARESGDAAAAEAYYLASIDKNEGLGYAAAKATDLANLGKLLRLQGRWAEALEIFASAINLLTAQDRDVLAFVKSELGAAQCCAGQAVLACETLREAAQLFDLCDFEVHYGVTLSYLTQACLAAGELHNAADALARAEAVYAALGGPHDLDIYPALQEARRAMAAAQAGN